MDEMKVKRSVLNSGNLNTERFKNIIERYLRRYANFNKYINSLNAKIIFENDIYKFIKLKRTKGFIVINKINKAISIIRKVPDDIATSDDEFIIKTVCSLYNERGYNPIIFGTHNINNYNKLYNNILTFIKTGNIIERNNIIDNISTTPDKLIIRSKVKNLEYYEHGGGVIIEIIKYSMNGAKLKLYFYDKDRKSWYEQGTINKREFIFLSEYHNININY